MGSSFSITSLDALDSADSLASPEAALPVELVRRLSDDAASYWPLAYRSLKPNRLPPRRTHVRENYWPLAYQWLQDSPFYSGATGGSGVTLGGASGTVNDRRGGRDLPLFWSEPDLRGFRVLSRFLCDTNPFAIGFLATLVNYHIRKGFGWQACKIGTKKTPYPVDEETADPVVRKGQHILDTWRDKNQWLVRSREAYRRFRRDGEVCGRLFWDRATMQRQLSVFRFVEPEQIGDPDGATDGPRSFGVLTHPLDVLTFFGLFIRDPEGTGLEGEWVTANPYLDCNYLRQTCGIDDYFDVTPGTLVFVKANVDCTIKRGLPDFFPVKDTLDAIRRLLRNTLLTACDQASIAWIEQFGTFTGPQIASLVDQQVIGGGQTVNVGGDANPWPWPWFPGLVANMGGQKYRPGTILRTEGNRQFTTTPASGNVPNYIAVEQAAIRGCCVRWNMPELTGSSDSSQSPYASALAADMPFRVSVEGNQGEWGELWERPTALAVLDLARDAGLLTPEERAMLDVEVFEPSLITAKAGEETSRRKTLNEARVLSVQTWQLQENLDPQHEAENFKAFDEAQQKAGIPPAGQSPPTSPPPPTSPYPAGGGEGGQFGGILSSESFRSAFRDVVREALAESESRKEGEVWKGPSGKWFTLKDGHVVPHAGPTRTGTLQPVNHPAAHALMGSIAAAPSLTDEQRETYGHAATHVLSNVPKFGRDRIAQHITSAVFYPDTKSLGLAVVQNALAKPNLSPEQKKKIEDWKAAIESGQTQMGGAYLRHAKSIHLDGGMKAEGAHQVMPGRHGGTSQTEAEIYAHELGHAIDGPTWQISNSARWLEVFDKEIGPKGNVNGEPRLTQYAQEWPHEGLAEFCRLVYAGNVPLDRIEAEFPLASKFWKEAKLWPGS